MHKVILMYQHQSEVTRRIKYPIFHLEYIENRRRTYYSDCTIDCIPVAINHTKCDEADLIGEHLKYLKSKPSDTIPNCISMGCLAAFLIVHITLLLTQHQL